MNIGQFTNFTVISLRIWRIRIMAMNERKPITSQLKMVNHKKCRSFLSVPDGLD
jgi:hypothetical protein